MVDTPNTPPVKTIRKITIQYKPHQHMKQAYMKSDPCQKVLDLVSETAELWHGFPEQWSKKERKLNGFCTYSKAFWKEVK